VSFNQIIFNTFEIFSSYSKIFILHLFSCAKQLQKQRKDRERLAKSHHIMLLKALKDPGCKPPKPTPAPAPPKAAAAAAVTSGTPAQATTVASKIAPKPK